MKTRLIFILFLLSSTIAFSQSAETIVDALEDNKSGSGSVVIESDSDIDKLLGTPNKRAEADEDYVMAKMSGFRILAYMSNDQRKAKGEASRRRSLITEEFSSIGTYLNYDSPNWKLLVGDFLTREEATLFKQQIQKIFPQLGKEMYIVPDIINVPVEK